MKQVENVENKIRKVKLNPLIVVAMIVIPLYSAKILFQNDRQEKITSTQPEPTKIVVTPTSVITIKPTKEEIKVEATTTIDKTSSYTKTMTTIMQKQTASLDAISGFMSQWPDLNELKIKMLGGYMAIVMENYDEAVLLEPPNSLISVHQKYLKAFKLAKEAMPTLATAMDNMDTKLMNQYTQKITQSTTVLLEANKELDLITN